MEELDSGFPSVAIGLCVRNCEKTIAKTIKSITELDYPRDRFNLIVVDGCSTDNTVGVTKNELRNTNVKTVFLSDNRRGLSYARQLVVDNCDSKYVAWVDGDNVLPQNFLKSQVKYMEKHPQAGFCGASIIPLGESIVARLQGYQWVLPAFDRKKAGYFMGKTGIQGTICRVKAIVSVGGFDSSIKGAGEDVDLFIRMKLAGWRIGSNYDTRIYHFMRDSWRALWKESVWWGNAEYYLTTKHRLLYPSVKRRVGLSILECIRLTFRSLRLTKDLTCIMMPIHYGIRRVGFLTGYFQARRNKYGPRARASPSKFSCIS